ncbi:MAG TPA: hypothetical protein VEL07_18520 [Planctomycetota bacterium]|nr:hypothetical protein [Planctomycetota bacterium]
MKRRLPWILLAFSAVLNIGFVVGFVIAAGFLSKLSTPAGRAEWAADHLELEPQQRRAYDEASAAWLTMLAAAEARVRPEQEAFWAEMVRDGSDLAEARRRFAPLIAHQESLMDDGLVHLHRIFQSMDLERRRELARMLAEQR